MPRITYEYQTKGSFLTALDDMRKDHITKLQDDLETIMRSAKDQSVINKGILTFLRGVGEYEYAEYFDPKLPNLGADRASL
jgi:hypothetical protein